MRAALGASRGALRRTLLAESLVLCGTRRPARRAARAPARERRRPLRRPLLRARARRHRGPEPARGSAAAWRWSRRWCSPTSRGCRPSHAPARAGRRAAACGSRRARAAACASSPSPRWRSRSCCWPARACCSPRSSRCRRPNTGYDTAPGAGARRAAADRGPGPKGCRLLSRKRRGGSRRCPGVERVAVGNFVPWRDADDAAPGFPFTVEGYAPAAGEEDPHARLRIVTPGFFAVLGVPLVAGRDFTDDDRRGREPVVIVSQSVAQRLFPNGDALDRRLWWTDPLLRQAGAAAHRRRRRGRGRRERRAGAGAHGLSPAAADALRRPPVRARVGRPVRARDAGDADHPRDLARTSRWSAPRRSRTCARRCWRPSG